MYLTPSARHSVHTSKVLLRIVVVLLIIIQCLGTIIVHNVYERFVQLEQENMAYDQQLEELKTKIEILTFAMNQDKK